MIDDHADVNHNEVEGRLIFFNRKKNFSEIFGAFCFLFYLFQIIDLFEEKLLNMFVGKSTVSKSNEAC